MYKYKNTSDIEQTIVAEGEVKPRIVKPGETVESSVAIENPNFELASGVNGAPSVPAAEATETETQDKEVNNNG